MSLLTIVLVGLETMKLFKLLEDDLAIRETNGRHT